MLRASLLASTILALLPACSSLKSEMRQAENAYNHANYEDALRWFEALEQDEPRMKVDDRARFHYLRGMASYRLGKRDDALYELSLAREIVEHEGANLEPEYVAEMNAVLDELTPTDDSHRARPLSGDERLLAP
jgi:hypothetical protein